MSSPHAWVTNAIGVYLVVVWLTAAFTALLAALLLPWGARLCRRLGAGAKAPTIHCSAEAGPGAAGPAGSSMQTRVPPAPESNRILPPRRLTRSRMPRMP